MKADSVRQELFLGQLEQHKSILHKVARAYCGNSSDREDLVQEMVAQLWRSFEGFDGRSRFSTWMYSVALNVAISFIRREGRRGRSAAQHESVLLEELPAREPAERTSQAELLEREIGRLPEFDKALVLLYLDGNDYATIATLLGISVSNVGTRLSRLKARLAEFLHDSARRESGGSAT